MSTARVAVHLPQGGRPDIYGPYTTSKEDGHVQFEVGTVGELYVRGWDSLRDHMNGEKSTRVYVYAAMEWSRVEASK